MLLNKIYWAILKISRSSSVGRLLVDIGALYFYKLFRSGRTFKFQRQTYKYFYALYNRTIASERIVEVPLGKKLLDDYEGKDILEVGNVLPHYFRIPHDVIDKYEKGENVINEDAVNINLEKNYDLIISISTMEHVGYNYGESSEPEKSLRSIENLKKYLKPGGKMVITVPVNHHNPLMNKLVKTQQMPFTNHYYMRRINFMNDWEETDYKGAISSANYDSYYANANAIYIGVYENSGVNEPINENINN